MTRVRLQFSVHGIAFAFACSTLFAQGYNRNGPGGRSNHGNNGQRSGDEQDSSTRRGEGTEYGLIMSVRAFGSHTSNVGSIGIKTTNGRQFMADLSERTRYLVGGNEIERDKLSILLVKDVPVIVQWHSSAQSHSRVATSIEIRTVRIEGTIKTANTKRLTVSATPVNEPTAEEPVAPPIHAGGRRVADPPPKKAPPKPVAKNITLSVSPNVTNVTLDGKKTDASALKARMQFDALVMDGGARLVFEMNARSEGGDGGPKPGAPPEKPKGGPEKKKP